MYHVKYIFFCIVLVCYGEGRANDWFRDPNLFCRDNDNRPTDWWYIYKPPARSFVERGRYFAFVTPYTDGRWEASNLYITSSSMLLNTLAPLFRRTYQSHLATAVYTESHGDMGSSMMGVLLADELGGIWITHTVPGLPDLSQDVALFPEDEIENGHMMSCMTLDYPALENIIKVLHVSHPNFTQIRVPPQLAEALPNWNSLAAGENLAGKTKSAVFITRQQKLNPMLVVRKPGGLKCLYKTFAKSSKVILDIYGDRDPDHQRPVCYEDYGIRKIDSISLKFPTEVHYVNNASDRFGFAVSTAAHWQTTVPGPAQYWTCTGSYEREGAARRAALLVCVQHYELWAAFTNLKVKEPAC